MNAVAKQYFQRKASTGPAFNLLCSFSANDRKYCFWAQSLKHLTLTVGLFCFDSKTENVKNILIHLPFCSCSMPLLKLLLVTENPLSSLKWCIIFSCSKVYWHWRHIHKYAFYSSFICDLGPLHAKRPPSTLRL